MDQPHDKLIMALVHACTDLDDHARSELLDRECNGDVALRARVESLLAEDGGKTGVHPSIQRLANALPEHYRLIELIGSGGMAEVFLAEDTRLHRKVAIKFLNDALRDDPERMRRFTQEARSASALNHPNIITIHDIGESDGVQFIVSEYVEGETLATRMTRGRISIPETIDIAIRIASALDSSHRAGIVHRDLKPENIMLRADGGLKVVDFGLAKGSGIFDQQLASVEIVTTSPGLILGTPRYMSPEQARGVPLDGRSDVFSLGIILFEMITGRTPFPGATVADTLAAILRHEPRPITDYVKDAPPKLIKIIGRALKKDPEDRYRSMASLLADLEDLRLDLTLPNRPAVDTVVLPRFRALTWTVPVAIVAAVIVIIAGWWYFTGRRSAVVVAGAMRNVPITSWSSISAEAGTTASFSPDARMVAFGSTRSGAMEIWSKPTSGGEPIQVTRDGFSDQYPVWSPDGQEIVFFSSRGDTRGLWKVSFTGGQETQLIGGLSVSARPLRWVASKGIFFEDGSDLSLLDPASGARTAVTDLGSSGIRPRAYAVSSDGAAFAFSVKDGDAWKLKYKRFADSSIITVATLKESIDSIAFHPNGSSIFYSSETDGTKQIFLTTVDGATPVQVSSSGTDLTLHDVSPDGSKILYGTINETSDLWAINLSDHAPAVVANDVSEEYWPEFSPDGRSIVYETAPQADSPYRGSVLVRQVQSKAAPVVLAADGFAPVWSRDGQWIAYFRRTETGIAVWKVRPSAADASMVAEGQIWVPNYSSTPYLKVGINHLTWSPDSSAIAYSSKKGGTWDIWLSSADGSSARPLSINTDPTRRVCCVTWSPDGSLVAVTSEPLTSDGNKIWRELLARGDGSEPKEIFSSKNQFRFMGYDEAGHLLIAQRAETADAAPAPAATNIYQISQNGEAKLTNTLHFAYSNNINLTADGRTIIFVTRENDTSAIWSVSALGGTPRKVFTENDPKVLISNVAISPDAKTLVFGEQARTNVLSMLTN